MDASHVALRRIHRVGPDSLIGVGAADSLKGRRVSVVLDDVRSLRVKYDPEGSNRRLRYAGAAAFPAALMCISSLNDPNCIQPDATLMFLGAGVGCGAMGFAVGWLLTPSPVEIPIAPLSQFPDAPRQGVGLRE